MSPCRTCKWFMPLSPGHAAICGERWQHLKWNDAVPLVSKDHGGCEKHEIPAPGHGAHQGAVDSHGSQDSLPAGRPA